MGFWSIAVPLVINLGLWAINKYLLSEEGFFTKPGEPGLEFAQATIGSPIPYVYGTTRIDSPVLVWYGNTTIDTLGPTNPQVDMLFVLGTPSWDEAAAPWSNWRTTNPPKLITVYYGDLALKIRSREDNPADIDKPILHGEGGIVHTASAAMGFESGVEFFDGRADQLVTSYPADGIAAPTTRLDQAFVSNGNIDRSLVPGYRHQMLAAVLMSGTGRNNADDWGTIDLFGGFWPGGRLAQIAFEVQSLGPEPIGIDANPAWVLYDLICSPVWKLGFDAANVDLTTFETAADILTTEEHGISLVIYQNEDATRVIAGILAQIDGVLFEDPATGKINLVLIRAVSPIGLPEFTVDNTDRPTIGITGWRETHNQIRLKWTNRENNYKADVALDQRLANAVGQDNKLRTKEVDFPGVTTKALADKLKARELAVASRPLMTASVVASREFYDLLPSNAIKATWPQLGLSAKVFRVLNVDQGQLADSRVRVMLIEDVFDNTLGGFTTPDPPVVTRDILPLTDRSIDEAPWWLVNAAQQQGLIPDLTQPRLLGLASLESGSDAVAFQGLAHPPGFFGLPSYLEPPLQHFPIAGSVATAYAGTKAPYDTTTGLVVSGLAAVTRAHLVATPHTASEIAFGANLILVRPSNSLDADGEFMAYESATDNGDGTVTLNNVWRELLDTAPVDHAAGESVFWVSVNHVGRRGWTVGTAEILLLLQGLAGGKSSGDDFDHYIPEILGRLNRPLRVAHLQLDSIEHADGTAGTSGTGLKAVSVFEGGLDATWLQRELEALLVVRGDDDPVPAWAAEEGVTFEVWAQKMDGLDDEDEIEADRIDGVTGLGATAILVGKVGHGAIDVIVHTVNEDGLRSWQSPRIRVTAKTWRNLLANGSGEYGALLPGWVDAVGTFAAQSGTDSLSKSASGTWLQPATHVSGASSIKQTIDVTGYKATGLTAIATWYTREITTSADDTSALGLRALDAADAELATVTSANPGSPDTHWLRREQELDLPEGTTQIEVTLLGAGSVDFGATDTGFTGVRVQVGQFSSELLTNPSFDS